MLSILLFVLPFVLGILGAHWAVQATVVKFFDVTSPGVKVATFVLPLALTLSWIGAAALADRVRSPIVDGWAVFASVWLGLFIQVLMAVGLVWLVWLAGRLAGRIPDMRIVCLAALGIAVVVTGWGIWHARAPRVKTIDVEMADLPPRWEGRTIVHLSDVHLGTVRRAGYARRVVERVNGLEPDLVLITGDLFDGMGGDLDSFVEPLDRLEARHGVFFVTGNHEGYLGLDSPLATLAKTHIRVLDNEVVVVDGLQIVGVSFPEHDRKDDAKKALTLGDDIDPALPSILMFHTPTDVETSAGQRGEQQTRTYFSPNTEFSFAREHGIDLQLSGHTHQGQFFPFTLVAEIIFKGHNHGLERIGDLQVYTTSGTGTWGPPMRLASSSEIVVVRPRPASPR